MISLPETGAVLGGCGCGAVVRVDSFRDVCSYTEWRLSGFCQRCQDRVYLGLDEQGLLSPSCVRFGVLGAYLADDAAPTGFEVALLPFLFVAEFRLLVWDAFHLLRVGPSLGVASLSDLEPMGHLLEGHYVRLTEIASFADPRLNGWFSDLELLLVRDRQALATVLRLCPALGSALGVSLTDALPWRDFALGPSPVDGPASSPLALCARMAASLARLECPPSNTPRTAAWHLLDALRTRFPDSSPHKGS